MPLGRKFCEGDRVLLRQWDDPRIDRAVLVPGMRRYFGTICVIRGIGDGYFSITDARFGFPVSAIECLVEEGNPNHDSSTIDMDALIALMNV